MQNTENHRKKPMYRRGENLTLISPTELRHALQLQLPRHTGHASAISSSFK